ncbi:hypothetical protein BBK36DRAFT_1145496 [Trichoderma citrinoviride]|uniref:Uncharacterized protein n=1 Tax=Trichoderma citrinoviride TaxID=58853 RepID=A0A2T4AX81_9HYPO|nr:hypothetical protein BBK36DRAFT_1145496 [Trichoderma citrinoviride]PTB61676.1 hypothetical protein BBK36DRAFT_1145496 [Trichoderma citrinoviride]
MAPDSQFSRQNWRVEDWQVYAPFTLKWKLPPFTPHLFERSECFAEKVLPERQLYVVQFTFLRLELELQESELQKGERSVLDDLSVLEEEALQGPVPECQLVFREPQKELEGSTLSSTYFEGSVGQTDEDVVRPNRSYPKSPCGPASNVTRESNFYGMNS